MCKAMHTWGVLTMDISVVVCEIQLQPQPCLEIEFSIYAAATQFLDFAILSHMWRSAGHQNPSNLTEEAHKYSFCYK